MKRLQEAYLPPRGSSSLIDRLRDKPEPVTVTQYLYFDQIGDEPLADEYLPEGLLDDRPGAASTFLHVDDDDLPAEPLRGIDAGVPPGPWEP